MTSNIMILDSDSSNLNLIQQVLRAEGFHVETADNRPQQSVILKWMNRLDLIIIDEKVPGFSEIYRELGNFPRVIFSLHSGSEYLKQGIEHFMIKPYGIKELVAKIRTFLRK
ncbi:MAG TPA: response regulator [Bacillota bacterium]|nr:response regulator [Bacillota bacterium]